VVFGRIISLRSITSAIIFGLVYLAVEFGGFSFFDLFLGGCFTIAIACFCWSAYPGFTSTVEQRKNTV